MREENCSHKMKAFKIVLMVIGGIAIVLVVGIFIFMKTASNETKESLLKDTVFEGSGVSREVYVKCDVTSFRKNFSGNKWVIGGRLYATSDKQNYTSQTVQFNFSDGKEIRIFAYRLNGSQTFARPFEVRIEGHRNASFLGAEVIGAD